MTGTAGNNPYSTRAKGMQKGDFWWTMSTTPDGANVPNRKSLTGLYVEKLRGEGSRPWTRCVAEMGHGSRKF